MSAIPLCKLVRVPSDAASVAVPTVLYAVYLFAGSDATSLILYDAGSATGTQVIEFNTAATQGLFVDMSNLGGVSFPSVGIYADIAGTGAVAYLWCG